MVLILLSFLFSISSFRFGQGFSIPGIVLPVLKDKTDKLDIFPNNTVSDYQTRLDNVTISNNVLPYTLLLQTDNNFTTYVNDVVNHQQSMSEENATTTKLINNLCETISDIFQQEKKRNKQIKEHLKNSNHLNIAKSRSESVSSKPFRQNHEPPNTIAETEELINNENEDISLSDILSKEKLFNQQIVRDHMKIEIASNTQVKFAMKRSKSISVTSFEESSRDNDQQFSEISEKENELVMTMKQEKLNNQRIREEQKKSSSQSHVNFAMHRSKSISGQTKPARNAVKDVDENAASVQDYLQMGGHMSSKILKAQSLKKKIRSKAGIFEKQDVRAI